MVRKSIWSLALFFLAGVAAAPAEGPKDADKEGFRVYTRGIRCGQLRLHGVYSSDAEAFRVLAELRGKSPLSQPEVTAGSEGKTMPAGAPVFFHVYKRARCGWDRVLTSADTKKVA